MITIAITGGVATGKSSVMRMLTEHWGDQAAFFSSDEAVHQLLTTPEIKTKITKVFGRGVLDAAGEVERGKLRRIVFGDPPLRRKLEDILHPGVFEAGQEAFLLAIDGHRDCFVYEIPLLYEVESKQERDFDLVVGASEETQRLRLAEKRRLDPEITQQLLNSQMPMDLKVCRADYVIWNDGTETELEEQVLLLTEFLQPLLAEGEIPLNTHA